MTTPARAPVPAVRVVILNWNGGSTVLDAVEAVLRSRWPANRLSLVVVDNASTDGSDVEIERRFPVVEVRRAGANLGFPGNNLAMGDLDGLDYVALVNNDAFVEPDWLTPLVATAEADDGLGAICPKLVFAPRFCALEVRAPAFRPGGSDPRSLSVQLGGVSVDGVDRWRHTWFGPGCHGQEPGGPDGEGFRWLDGHAALGLPLWDGTRVPARASLRLSAPRPVTVELTSGRCHPGGPGGVADVAVEVGPVPRTVEVEVRGPAFDVVQNAGSLLLEGGYGADRGFLQPDRGQLDEPADVWSWCGGAVLLRRRYLEDVGLFWPPYFMYYEDTDLAWRGRARGWRYRYEPRSVVRHLHGMSAGEGSPLFEHYVERNRLVVLTRNAPAGVVVQAAGRAVLTAGSLARRDAVASLRARRVPHLVTARRRAASLAAYGRLLPRLVRDRRALRRRQRVPDDQLMAWVQPRSSHPH